MASVSLELDLLNRVMAGSVPTSDDIDALLHASTKEGLLVEYKEADPNPKKVAAMIRQYVSGFANSDGGLLFIGIANTLTVTGMNTPGGGDAAEWAVRCLTPIASYFSPPPRFHVIDHSDGTILLISTLRSINLIPCIEGGKPIYYFRFHEQTLPAPDYLIGDLFHGRRQHPDLHITEPSLGRTLRFPSDNYQKINFQFNLGFRVENRSFIWAKNIRIDLISFTESMTPIRQQLSPPLLSYIDIHEVTNYKPINFDSKTVSIASLSALDSSIIGNYYEIRLPLNKNGTWFKPYIWKAALVIFSEGSPPIWYQIAFTVDNSALQADSTGQHVDVDSNAVTIERVSHGNPVVGWEGFT